MNVGGCRKACAFLLGSFLMCRQRFVTENPRAMVSLLPQLRLSSCPLDDFPKFLKSVQFMLENSLFDVGPRSVYSWCGRECGEFAAHPPLVHPVHFPGSGFQM